MYLGQLIKLNKDYDCKIERRITIVSKTFSMNKEKLMSKMPAMTYGCKTRKLTKLTEKFT